MPVSGSPLVHSLHHLVCRSSAMCLIDVLLQQESDSLTLICSWMIHERGRKSSVVHIKRKCDTGEKKSLTAFPVYQALFNFWKCFYWENIPCNLSLVRFCCHLVFTFSSPFVILSFLVHYVWSVLFYKPLRLLLFSVSVNATPKILSLLCSPCFVMFICWNKAFLAKAISRNTQVLQAEKKPPAMMQAGSIWLWLQPP